MSCVFKFIGADYLNKISGSLCCLCLIASLGACSQPVNLNSGDYVLKLKIKIAKWDYEKNYTYAVVLLNQAPSITIRLKNKNRANLMLGQLKGAQFTAVLKDSWKTLRLKATLVQTDRLDGTLVLTEKGLPEPAQGRFSLTRVKTP